MISLDLLNALALFSLVGLVAATYAIRIAVRGRAQSDRVDRQGSSILLGKGLMEMAVWGLKPIARLAILLRITPNQISWASLVLGGIAGSFLAYGSFGTAALIATFSAFLDSLDGMVARLTSVASNAGEVLDATIDRYVEFFFLAGLVIYYREVPAMQILSLFALMGSFMISYSTAKAEALHMEPPPGIMRRPERAFYLILGAALSPIPFPWAVTYAYATPIQWPMAIAIGFVALLSNVSAIERLYTIAHAARMREEAAQLEHEEGQDSAPAKTLSHDHGTLLATQKPALSREI